MGRGVERWAPLRLIKKRMIKEKYTNIIKKMK